MTPVPHVVVGFDPKRTDSFAPPNRVLVTVEGLAPRAYYDREALDVLYELAARPFATSGRDVIRFFAARSAPTPRVVVNTDTLAAFAGVSTEETWGTWGSIWRRVLESLPAGAQHIYAQIQEVENALVAVSAVGYDVSDRSDGALPRVGGLISPEWTLVSARRSLSPTSSRPSFPTLPLAKRTWLHAVSGQRWWGAVWERLSDRLLFLQQPAVRELFPTHREWHLAPPPEVGLALDHYFGRVELRPNDAVDVPAAALDELLHPDRLPPPWLGVPLTSTALDLTAPVGKRAASRLRQEAAACLYARAAMLVGLVERSERAGIWRGFHNLILTANGIYFTLDDRVPVESVVRALHGLDFSPYDRPIPPHVYVGASWGSLVSAYDTFADLRVQMEATPEWPETCRLCGRVAPSARDLASHLAEVHGVQ